MRRPQIGEIIAEKYVVEELLGEGGYAWVFRTTNVRMDSLQYALKVLKPQHVRDNDVTKRFRQEAEMAARIDNRNVVRIMDFGVSERGIPYMAMEYVQGESLDGLIHREGFIPQSHVARWSSQILNGLQAAHELGIVHRDLKPPNILIEPRKGEKHPVSRVTDFGIGKLLQDEGSLNNATIEGVVLCTPQYAAPEMLRGEPSTMSDIYALGQVMAEMLDGRAPYAGGTSVQIASRHLDARPVPLGPKTKASVLRHVIGKACAKDLSYRYKTAADMLRELDAASSYIPGRATDPPLVLKIKLPQKRRRPVDADDRHFAEGAPTDQVDIDTSWIDAEPEARRDERGEVLNDSLSVAITTSVPRQR